MPRDVDLIEHLDQCMQGQLHIDRPEYVWDVIDKLTSKFMSMSAEQRDFLHNATQALEQGTSWKIETVEVTEDDGYAD